MTRTCVTHIHSILYSRQHHSNGCSSLAPLRTAYPLDWPRASLLRAFAPPPRSDALDLGLALAKGMLPSTVDEENLRSCKTTLNQLGHLCVMTNGKPGSPQSENFT